MVAGVPGLEPRLTEPESVGLPITPYPIGACRTGEGLYPSRPLTPNQFADSASAVRAAPTGRSAHRAGRPPVEEARQRNRHSLRRPRSHASRVALESAGQKWAEGEGGGWSPPRSPVAPGGCFVGICASGSSPLAHHTWSTRMLIYMRFQRCESWWRRRATTPAWTPAPPEWPAPGLLCTPLRIRCPRQRPRSRHSPIP